MTKETVEVEVTLPKEQVDWLESLSEGERQRIERHVELQLLENVAKHEVACLINRSHYVKRGPGRGRVRKLYLSSSMW